MTNKTSDSDQQQYIANLNQAANSDARRDISRKTLVKALDNIRLSGSDISAEKDALLNFSKSAWAKGDNDLQRKAVHDLGLIGDQDVAAYLLTLLKPPPPDYSMEEAVLNALRDIGSTKKIETVNGESVGGLIQTLTDIIEENPQGGLPLSVKRAARYALLAVLGENANYAADRDFRERLEIHALGFYILIVGGFFALIGFLAYISYWAFLTPFLRDFIFIACAGGLGSTVACGRAYYRYKGDTINKFSLDWSWWYIMRPWIGMVAGLIAYLLIVAGIVTFGASANATAQGTLAYPLPVQSIALFIVASFLAGHAFAWFDNKIDDVFKSLFGDTGKEDLGGEKK